jgi:hypothetical protein
VSEDSAPEHRKLEGNLEYEQALDTVFARPGRKLRIFDRLLGTAYNGATRYDLLRRFLLASRTRTIQIVLHDTSNLQRDCPRLINLLREFSHAVTIHETEPQAITCTGFTTTTRAACWGWMIHMRRAVSCSASRNSGKRQRRRSRAPRWGCNLTRALGP